MRLIACIRLGGFARDDLDELRRLEDQCMGAPFVNPRDDRREVHTCERQHDGAVGLFLKDLRPMPLVRNSHDRERRNRGVVNTETAAS